MASVHSTRHTRRHRTSPPPVGSIQTQQTTQDAYKAADAVEARRAVAKAEAALDLLEKRRAWEEKERLRLKQVTMLE